jgi:RND family efflux transporter MFP subunit
MNETSIQPSEVKNYLRRGGFILVALAVVGIGYRVYDRRAQAEETQENALAHVQYITANKGTKSEGLDLPATLVPFIEAPIYARTSGYLKNWKVDIGAHVEKNTLLAEIDAPDLDQQLRQANADLETATANAEIALATHKRWQQLLANEAVSPQDAEEKAADARAKQALMMSARANQARLAELVGFKRITAPFAGTITARNTDVGQLINAGQNSGDALFKVADTHIIRVYVMVPADSANRIHVHQKAQLVVAGSTGTGFSAEVTNISDALDPLTRTMQVQLQVNNVDNKLRVGSFATAHFDIEGRQAITIPANALIFRSQGLMVASVDHLGVVTLKKVVMGRDLGSEVELNGGIDEADHIIINPPDSIVSGQHVKAEPAPQPASKAQS